MNKLKVFSFALLALVVLPAHATVQIFACEPEWASLSREIGGDKVAVYTATTAHQDVHHIQARPSLIAQVRLADMLVCTGAELEAGWLPLLLQRAANAKVQPGKPGNLMMADQVKLLDAGTAMDRSMGDVHPAGNPHIHLDPYRIAELARALAARLSELDAAHAAFYQQSVKQFSQRWQEAISRWEQQAQPLRDVPVVVHHRDWRYLLNWLGMNEVATLEPKPGLPPNASYLSALKQRLAQQPARMVLRTNYQDGKPSAWLAQQTAIMALALPYTVGGSARAVDLFSLYDDIIAQLLAVPR